MKVEFKEEMVPFIDKFIEERNKFMDFYKVESFKEDLQKYIDYVYSLVNEESPNVYLARNPNIYIILYTLIFENFNTYYDSEELDYDSKYKEIRDDIIKEIEYGNNAELLKNKLLTLEYGISKRNEKINIENILKECKSMIGTKDIVSYTELISVYTKSQFLWLDTMKDFFDYTDDIKQEIHTIKELVYKTNILESFIDNKNALILDMPYHLDVNKETENLNYHNTKDAVIKFDFNYNIYYINEREFPAEYFEKYKNGNLTFDDFINEDNEEIKAGIITLIKENEGNQKLLEFLNAKLIDEKTIVHKTGHTETAKLYHTKEKYSFLQDRNGKTNQPFAWLSITCPSTGINYLLDTSADITDALEAMKFHRPSKVPMELLYSHTEFNN